MVRYFLHFNVQHLHYITPCLSSNSFRLNPHKMQNFPPEAPLRLPRNNSTRTVGALLGQNDRILFDFFFGLFARTYLCKSVLPPIDAAKRFYNYVILNRKFKSKILVLFQANNSDTFFVRRRA